MKLDKPRFCLCGNPATLLKQHEPICERCHAMEITLNVTKKRRATTGVSTGRHVPCEGINWENYWIPFTDPTPIAGASLEILEKSLKAA